MSVIYEVTLDVDREIATEFDEWLSAHVAEMLELPGFVSAETLESETDEEDRVQRVTRYTLEGRDELNAYLAGQAAAMRQDAIERFGERFQASRRVLSESVAVSPARVEPSTCLNCGASLGGQYCGNCGQRANSRMISIWELTRDAFGDLFELDSRLWRTVLPLLTRPGQLTRDYLEGRRARYMPPFRTYLVLSIIFFLVAFFDPREELGILFEPAIAPTVTEQQEIEKQEAALKEELISDLETEGIIVGSPTLKGQLREQPEDDEPGIDITIPTDEDPSGGMTITVDDDETTDDCDMEDFAEAELPRWLAARLSQERVKAMCEKVVADKGKTLFNKLIENIPAGLIVLLPLMALALKMLYPLAQRYYVEHLLFFVHFHAFFFLLLTLQITLVRISDKLSFPTPIAPIVVVASSIYIPVYLYKAMRRVYAQGHWLTVPKFMALILTYIFGFSMMLAFALLLAAFSI
ncbi:MAG: DUF4286 family protein [Gammaproteobacteria bacterium]|nr:DUF4286 family protein [Gammaproteobacteria bacterium]